MLRVPPKPVGAGSLSTAADDAAFGLQQDLLRQLGFADRSKDAKKPDALHGELSMVFDVATAAQPSQAWLLVVDDVWDQAIVQHLRCSTMRGVILVTAREAVCSDDDASTVWLKPDPGSRQAAQALMSQVLRGAAYHNQVCLCVACWII